MDITNCLKFSSVQQSYQAVHRINGSLINSVLLTANHPYKDDDITSWALSNFCILTEIPFQKLMRNKRFRPNKDTMVSHNTDVEIESIIRSVTKPISKINPLLQLQRNENFTDIDDYLQNLDSDASSRNNRSLSMEFRKQESVQYIREKREQNHHIHNHLSTSRGPVRNSSQNSLHKMKIINPKVPREFLSNEIMTKQMKTQPTEQTSSSKLIQSKVYGKADQNNNHHQNYLNENEYHTPTAQAKTQQRYQVKTSQNERKVHDQSPVQHYQKGNGSGFKMFGTFKPQNKPLSETYKKPKQEKAEEVETQHIQLNLERVKPKQHYQQQDQEHHHIHNDRFHLQDSESSEDDSSSNADMDLQVKKESQNIKAIINKLAYDRYEQLSQKNKDDIKRQQKQAQDVRQVQAFKHDAHQVDHKTEKIPPFHKVQDDQGYNKQRKQDLNKKKEKLPSSTDQEDSSVQDKPERRGLMEMDDTSQQVIKETLQDIKGLKKKIELNISPSFNEEERAAAKKQSHNQKSNNISFNDFEDFKDYDDPAVINFGWEQMQHFKRK